MSFDRVSGSAKPAAAVAVAVVALLAGHGLAAADAERAAGPRLVQLSYEESRDGASRRYNLSAFVHKADRVTFAVRRHHRRLTATSRYNSHVTDTDLKPEDASHPWEIVRKGGGRKVLRKLRRALRHHGQATVRVIAQRGERRDKAKVRIRVAACTEDPPFYPLSCEIGL
jgi:hypothetical protein